MDSAREAMSVNGITPEMLEGAPMLYQIIPSLQEFIGDMPLLGHNLEFDLKFLCARSGCHAGNAPLLRYLRTGRASAEKAKVDL